MGKTACQPLVATTSMFALFFAASLRVSFSRPPLFLNVAMALAFFPVTSILLFTYVFLGIPGAFLATFFAIAALQKTK